MSLSFIHSPIRHLSVDSVRPSTSSGLWGGYSRRRDQNKLAEKRERVWLAAGVGAEVGAQGAWLFLQHLSRVVGSVVVWGCHGAQGSGLIEFREG